jgi:hypothetical protein
MINNNKYIHKPVDIMQSTKERIPQDNEPNDTLLLGCTLDTQKVWESSPLSGTSALTLDHFNLDGSCYLGTRKNSVESYWMNTYRSSSSYDDPGSTNPDQSNEFKKCFEKVFIITEPGIKSHFVDESADTCLQRASTTDTSASISDIAVCELESVFAEIQQTIKTMSTINNNEYVYNSLARFLPVLNNFLGNDNYDKNKILQYQAVVIQTMIDCLKVKLNVYK